MRWRSVDRQRSSAVVDGENVDLEGVLNRQPAGIGCRDADVDRSGKAVGHDVEPSGRIKGDEVRRAGDPATKNSTERGGWAEVGDRAER